MKCKKMTFTFNPETRKELGCNTYYKRDTTTCYRIHGEVLFFNTILRTTRYRNGEPEASTEIKVSNRDIDTTIEDIEKKYDLIRIG